MGEKVEKRKKKYPKKKKSSGAEIIDARSPLKNEKEAKAEYMKSLDSAELLFQRPLCWRTFCITLSS